jgi:alpha-tubulin suppressor-like RCC1 family protein
MKTSIKAFVIPTVALVISACDGDFGFGVGPLDFCSDGHIQATTMQISPSSLSLRVGQTTSVAIARTSPKETSNTCYELPSWSSSNSSVATAKGFEITAAGPGTAQLTATSGTASATVSVTVANVQVESLTIIAPTSLLVGQVVQARLTARDSAGNPVAIIARPAWTSSDNATMTVDETGIITARGSGVVTLRATVEGRDAALIIALTRGIPAVTFTAIATGLQHTCGIAGGGAVPQGSIVCWGIISGESRLAPSWMITGGRTFKTLEAGMFHSCAIAINGETLCWGRNTSGQIGDGTTSPRPDPTRVSTSESFVTLALGESFTCGLNGEGVTYCWGTFAGRSTTTPARLDTPRFRQIVAERYMLCGLTDAGEVHCLGAGQPNSYSAVTRISSPVAFNSIASSDYHTCGITSTGAAYCWGLNSSGQIGAAVILVPSPTILPGGLSFSSISPGGGSTCGITSAGAKCIGSTRLAGSVTSAEFYPIPGEYNRPLATISNGPMHGCAIDNEAIAWCWGLNTEGQVGPIGNAIIAEPIMMIVDPL